MNLVRRQPVDLPFGLGDPLKHRHVTFCFTHGDSLLLVISF